MTYDEMDAVVRDFVDEYFATGKYDRGPDAGGIFGTGTKSEVMEYRKRLKAFFRDNDVPKAIRERIARSRMGESFYLANGYGILSDEGLA